MDKNLLVMFLANFLVYPAVCYVLETQMSVPGFFAAFGVACLLHAIIP